MLEARPAARVPLDLNLRVWGIGANGRPFFQQAHTRNISNGGALLSGIEQDLNVGETIGLQHGEKKVRCQVVWLTNTGSQQKIVAGIKFLNGACPWTAELEAAQEPEPAKSNVRRWTRHKITIRIELHEHGSNVPLRVAATDVSAGGCYVETLLPLSVGTTLDVNFWIVTDRLSTRSIVRTCDPGVGMGLEFVGLRMPERQRFQGYLEALDPWSSSIAR